MVADRFYRNFVDVRFPVFHISIDLLIPTNLQMRSMFFPLCSPIRPSYVHYSMCFCWWSSQLQHVLLVRQ